MPLPHCAAALGRVALGWLAVTSLKVAALTLAAVLAAGCSSASTTSPALTATSSAPSTPTASTTRVPMQTAAGGEFLSPSGNISCEVDYHRAGLTQVYCQTITPAQSVTMNVTGGYQACRGQQCLGNPATGVPTLAYGTETGAGPFRCESASIGVTCIAGGKGFRISTSGITPVRA